MARRDPSTMDRERDQGWIGWYWERERCAHEECWWLLDITGSLVEGMSDEGGGRRCADEETGQEGR